MGLPLVAGIALVFAFLSSAMPSSGGDYVYNSRILHPALGFMSSFVFVFFQVFIMGFAGVVWSNYFLAGFLASLSQMTGSAALAAASSWFTSTTGTFVAGSVFIAFTGVLTLTHKGAWRFMRIGAVLALLFSFVSIVFLAVTPQSAFVHAFNNLYPGQYEAIIAQAQSKGWMSGYSLWATFLAISYVAFSYNGFSYSVYSAGEAKHASRSAPISVLAALFLCATIICAWLWAINHAFGENFIGAASYLYSAGISVPVTPSVNFLTNIIPQNPLVMLMVSLAFFLGYTCAVPSTAIPAIRTILCGPLTESYPKSCRT